MTESMRAAMVRHDIYRYSCHARMGVGPDVLGGKREAHHLPCGVYALESGSVGGARERRGADDTAIHGA